MYIHLKWRNRNSNLEAINIYRSTDPFGSTDLPDTLVTISGNLEEYVDDAVERDVEYYYLIEFTRGNDRVFSRLIKLKATVSSGPGPQDLLNGDYSSGYFGLFPAEEFLSYELITEHIGDLIINQPSHWIKYVYNGKICFLPYGSSIRNISWASVYHSGKVFGVEGPGPLGNLNSPNVTPTNQLYTFDFSGYTFKVRLIDGGAFDEPDSANYISTINFRGFPPAHNHNDRYAENEFDYCIRRFFTGNEYSPYGKQLAGLNMGKLVPHGNSTILTQNLRVRGAFLGVGSSFTLLPNMRSSSIDTTIKIGNESQYIYPLPVLELVS